MNIAYFMASVMGLFRQLLKLTYGIYLSVVINFFFAPFILVI